MEDQTVGEWSGHSGLIYWGYANEVASTSHPLRPIRVSLRSPLVLVLLLLLLPLLLLFSSSLHSFCSSFPLWSEWRNEMKNCNEEMIDVLKFKVSETVALKTIPYSLVLSLTSSDCLSMVIPKTKTLLGKRTSVAGPRSSSALPILSILLSNSRLFLL